MNTKKRGQRVELVCANELKAKGATILFRTHTCKMGDFWRGHDLAGLFDIVAYRFGSWDFIACSSTMSHYAEQRDEIAAFAKKCGLQGMNFEYWIKVRGGFRKFWLTQSGWMEQNESDGKTAM